MTSFMLVKAESLSTFPQAFQGYVRDFFEKRTIDGVEYFCAFRWTGTPSDGLVWYRRHKGNAPSHSVDIAHYKEGLKKGQSLNDWIWDYTRNSPNGDVVLFCGSDPSRRHYED